MPTPKRSRFLKYVLEGRRGLSTSVVALAFIGVAAACGSREQEDLQPEGAPAPQATATPLAPTRTSGNDVGTQTPRSTNALTSDCSDDLQLVTQVVNNGSKDTGTTSVRTVLLGRVAPNCGQGKVPVLSFATEHQVTLLPLMSCEIGTGRPAQITCRGNSSELLNNGVVTIPVLLESGTSYSDLRASINFQ